MQFLIAEFPVGKYPIGTQLDCVIERYTATSDGKEALIVDKVHVIGGKVCPYPLQYNISRTNGNLLSLIYPTSTQGTKALEHVPARLINLKYVTLGYGGKRYENRSWLFQPLDSIINSGEDWYLIQ